MIRKKRVRRPKKVFAFFCLLGFCLGAGSVFAQYYGTPYLQDRYGTDFIRTPDELGTERVLIELESPVLYYRSASFGIQPDTALHASIMAEQTELIASYQEQAASAQPEGEGATVSPWHVETYFARTVQIGPLSSILRTEYVKINGELRRQSYASTLLNTLHPEGFTFEDLFYPSRESVVRLDKILCDAVMDEKERRLGSRSIRGDIIDCAKDRRLSFMQGAPVILVPSTEPNLIGGLTFYYERGRIGEPDEGDYIIHIPQSDIRLDIRPDWITLFGGHPVIG